MVPKIKTQLVLKSDSSTEQFDPGKIARVTKAAGLETNEAAALAARVSQWVQAQNQSPIASQSIRQIVFAELKKTNAHAASLYYWYKQNENHHTS